MDDIDIFLDEDLGDEGDITTNSLFTNEQSTGIIIAKEDCVVAGIEENIKIFEKTGAVVNAFVKDGDAIGEGMEIMRIEGSIRSILKGERLALNFLGRMSGIATETRKIMDVCQKINQDVIIAATRKTTPGFRKYEKKAVKIGGGYPHRYGLFDFILVKDNHIKFIGSIEKTIRMIKGKIKGKTIEVEVENEKDAIIAAKYNVDVIMLDNFSPEDIENTVKKIREINSDIVVELSGGINAENISKYAKYADRISLGYLTHSIQNIDFSLEIL